MITEKAEGILNRVYQRVAELKSHECTKRKVLENLNKLYSYGRELEDEKSWQVREASSILLRGFDDLTEGTLISDRLLLARYEMQGHTEDLIAVYLEFISVLESCEPIQA
jgi:hypothetical protein